MLYARVKERVPKDAWDYFQVILSRVRELEDKPRILWFQDTSQDPEVQFLKKKKERDKFDRFVFPSDWSLEKYNLDLGVEYEKSVVLKNAIEPIPAHAKPKKGQYFLIKDQYLLIKEQYFLWFTEANIVKGTTLRMNFAEELLWLEYLTQI